MMFRHGPVISLLILYLRDRVGLGALVKETLGSREYRILFAFITIIEGN